jgi:hypothetical protein
VVVKNSVEPESTKQPLSRSVFYTDWSVQDMPDSFSRQICALAMQLNDEADKEQQHLMPCVACLACADTPEVEREREV